MTVDDVFVPFDFSKYPFKCASLRKRFSKDQCCLRFISYYNAHLDPKNRTQLLAISFSRLQDLSSLVQEFIQKGLVQTSKEMVEIGGKSLPVFIQKNQNLDGTLPEADKELTDEAKRSAALSEKQRIADKYCQLLASARKRNKDFNLTLADVKALLNRKTCYYTGVRFPKGTFDPLLHKTVDRIDSTKGYVKGNVVACTHQANLLKSELFESPVSKVRMDMKAFETFSKKVLQSLK